MTNGSMVVPVHTCIEVPTRRPKRPLTLGSSLKVEAVDIGPVDGDGGQRLDEGAMAERAEAVTRVGPETDGCGIERVGEAQGSHLELHEMHVEQGVDAAYLADFATYRDAQACRAVSYARKECRHDRADVPPVTPMRARRAWPHCCNPKDGGAGQTSAAEQQVLKYRDAGEATGVSR
jgi:hypothetical protein